MWWKLGVGQSSAPASTGPARKSDGRASAVEAYIGQAQKWPLALVPSVLVPSRASQRQGFECPQGAPPEGVNTKGTLPKSHLGAYPIISVACSSILFAITLASTSMLSLHAPFT